MQTDWSATRLAGDAYHIQHLSAKKPSSGREFFQSAGKYNSYHGMFRCFVRPLLVSSFATMSIDEAAPGQLLDVEFVMVTLPSRRYPVDIMLMVSYLLGDKVYTYGAAAGLAPF